MIITPLSLLPVWICKFEDFLKSHTVLFVLREHVFDALLLFLLLSPKDVRNRKDCTV